MRHLFIINPAAKKVKGRVKAIENEIKTFFRAHPDMRCDIYISAWCRDAMTYVRRYMTEIRASCMEAVRVHVIGGTGTLFEVVNGVIGFSCVEVAAHPYGRADTFLQYFGLDKLKLFSSLESLVFDEAIPMDAIRCGNNYGLCFNTTGMEAQGDALGDEWIEKGLPADLSYVGATALKLLRDKHVGQHYRIEVNDTNLEGYFASILIANGPCYGDRMYPAVDAHPDDGRLEVYVIKRASRLKILLNISRYTKGDHHKLPDLVSHYTATRIRISSDEVMCMCIDGENFYGMSVEFEVIPKAIRFVCPKGINLDSLPALYNKPESGPRGVLR